MEHTQDSSRQDAHRRHALLYGAFDAHSVRMMERPLLDSGVQLMQMAASALAQVASSMLDDAGIAPADSHVVVLAGAGDNGGDGLFAAARLADAGMSVTVIAVGRALHDEAVSAVVRAGGGVMVLDPRSDISGCAAGFDEAEAALRLSKAIDTARRATLIIDAMAGIGSHGALRGIAGSIAGDLGLDAVPPDAQETPGEGTPLVLAVDVPSGIGVDDGTLPGAYIPANVTVTFGALKPCAMLPPAAFACGAVTVVDFDFAIDDEIAVVEAVDADMARDAVRLPRHEDSKYDRGVVGLITGSDRYPGAARLSALAAARSNVGMVRYLGPPPARGIVLDALPEAVLGPGRVQSWVVGSGVPALGDDARMDGQQSAIATLLAGYGGEGLGDLDAGDDGDGRGGAAMSGRDSPTPVCVDAGALDLLPERVLPQVIITPHAGELATLLRSRGEHVDASDIAQRPWHWARVAHEITGATVLLKGSITIVVGDDGAGGTRTIVTGSAPSWLATAGAGDVLAGMLGGLLAQQDELLDEDPSLSIEIAAVAAYLHGLAARLASESNERGWRTPRAYGISSQLVPRTHVGHPIVASDVIGMIAQVIGDLVA